MMPLYWVPGEAKASWIGRVLILEANANRANNQHRLKEIKQVQRILPQDFHSLAGKQTSYGNQSHNLLLPEIQGLYWEKKDNTLGWKTGRVRGPIQRYFHSMNDKHHQRIILNRMKIAYSNRINIRQIFYIYCWFVIIVFIINIP